MPALATVGGIWPVSFRWRATLRSPSSTVTIRLYPKVTDGRSGGKAVRAGHLFGQKSGHRRFPFQPKGPPQDFQDRTENARLSRRDGLCHSGTLGHIQERVDPVPHLHAFRLVDEIDLARVRSVAIEQVGGLDVGGSRVFDVDGRDHV